MKSECCHQHPDNGSDLALQTEAQREETNLRAEVARLQDECGNLQRLNTQMHEVNEQHVLESARLQTALEGAERQLAEHGCYKVEREAFRERDGYKALAERRGEALEECQEIMAEAVTQPRPYGLRDNDPLYKRAEAAQRRAAIAMTPEEAREKGG